MNSILALTLPHPVLIYPYWNVNRNLFCHVTPPILSFNLSILECKCLCDGLIKRLRQVLIYPYWNVNEKITEIKDAGKRVLIYPYWNVNCSCCPCLRTRPAVLIYPYWNVNEESTPKKCGRCGKF